jgi:glycine/D-amino acid oxidase-like deaminating enzyme
MNERPVIIGAGIIGASLAYHLAKAGRPPLVVDAQQPGGIATAHSWAWINASWGTPDHYLPLRLRSIALWRQLAQEVRGLDVDFCGSLTWDMAPADLEQYIATRHAGYYRVVAVDADAIGRLEPRLRQRPQKAAHCLDEAVAEPVAAARALLAAAVVMGAEFRQARVAGILVDDKQITGLALQDGQRLHAHQIICAAGLGAMPLLADAGCPLSMSGPEGLLVHTDIMQPVLNGLVIAPDIHVRQTREGRLVGGFDFTGDILQSPEKDAERLLATINTMLDLPEPARLSFTTLGRRPTPGDGFPMLGSVAGIAGLTIAVMHSGVTLAPAVGALLAAEIVHGAIEPLLEHFRPARLLLPAS